MSIVLYAPTHYTPAFEFAPVDGARSARTYDVPVVEDTVNSALITVECQRRNDRPTQSDLWLDWDVCVNGRAVCV